MTISDSLPIQFWANGQNTFNDTVDGYVPNIHCFLQTFKSSDTIYLQFTDNVYTGYVLSIWETSTEELLDALNFTSIGTNVWGISIIATSFSNKKVTLFIHNDSKVVKTYSPSTWTDGSNAFNSKTSNQFIRNSGTTNTRRAQHAAVFPSNIQPLSIRARITVSGGGATQTIVNLNTLDISNAGSWEANQFLVTADGTYDVVFDFTGGYLGGGAPAWLNINNTCASSATTVTITLDPDQFLYLGVTMSDYLAKSDSINIMPTDSKIETILIEYSNNTNFDNIYYGGNYSPSTTFNLRIPAVFFDERNPQEQEDIELSNGEIVTIRQSIQQKKLLETGYMPNYMHLKLQKVLMHDTVSIDGETWRKRDSYDDSPIRKYNLKMAKVLLTKYDSVEKNTI